MKKKSKIRKEIKIYLENKIDGLKTQPDYELISRLLEIVEASKCERLNSGHGIKKIK